MNGEDRNILSSPLKCCSTQTKGDVMLRLGAVLVVLVTLCRPAMALYFLYPDWSALPENARQTYIAGAFDSLVSVATDEDGRIAAKHYDHCVVSAHISVGQLATNVMNFASQKPELHTLPASIVMAKYLAAAFGLPK
jgi:hypothetical protein